MGGINLGIQRIFVPSRSAIEAHTGNLRHLLIVRFNTKLAA